ncbi:MAG: hypothetical protein KTR31_35435 [Myxococcales bacterium]|nr:hypothetical protein [Myxococcales bacterium]
MSLVLWAFAACSSAPPGSDPPPSAPDAVDLRWVEEVLQYGFEAALMADAYALRDVYDDAMGASDTCPSVFNGIWYDDCETTDGVHFGGYVVEFEQAEPDASYWTLYGVATVSRPDGTALVLGGYAGTGEGVDEDFSYVYSYLYGTFHDSGPSSRMGPGHDADVVVRAYTHHTGPRALSVGGSLGALFDDPGVAVDFVGVTVTEAGWPEQPCVEQPVGRAAVRTPEGLWVDVDFGMNCTGCGQASTLNGDEGEVCVDAAGWLDWEVSPW